ncbi:DNA polymerase III subunit gamma/tau [Weissella diestrammenae]|uniref:DNA-directed DNA polymerase n=1 Tax=Weissella diestrammenae TaxID=1162633 RepID=A0A7G9T3I7_9LACO|nr:DNA polymerase III subunit gamma/tau [Weissella diestrammenae]MCM0582633.1 DNA polymerase III subunit gamma/tau [Weissella diestrammenae]QNN74662.1 DNA polymerase III subunit gamma/tau [Weissella diestrammenae]
MAYQALYRTWRPQTFGDMVGQEVVTRTLRNALVTNQMSHAYLFTGPRGTGKTSAAKIFAKAVNCLHPIDGEPDGTCEICQAADNGTLGDIIELDAASNNGVDEIREIREDVNYAPTMGQFKVYIIDEVHMLSTGAFNALLKTLEEPPANVIFILATTEPQKIPATIISRTQRFDFRRIDANDAYQRMVYILNERGDTYDETALRVIANAADGGMRDALSILDQALSFGNGQVTLENALLVTGSVTQALLGEYVQAVVNHESQKALAKLSEVLTAGKDAGRFIEDLISYARDLLLSTEAPELISLVPDNNFNQLAAEQAPEVWYHMIDILNETQQQIRYTNRPSIYLEVLTVKLSRPATTNLAAKSQPVTTESAQPVGIVGSQAVVSSDSKAEPIKTVESTKSTPIAESTPVVPEAEKIRVADRASTETKDLFAVLNQATRGDLNRVVGVWADVIATLPVSSQAMLNTAKPIAASETGMVLGFDFEIFRDNTKRNAELIATLTEKVQALTNAPAERQLVLITNEEWPALRTEWVNEHHHASSQAVQPEQTAVQQVTESSVAAIVDEPTTDAEVDTQAPVVKEALNLFGTDIVEVEHD